MAPRSHPRPVLLIATFVAACGLALVTTSPLAREGDGQKVAADSKKEAKAARAREQREAKRAKQERKAEKGRSKLSKEQKQRQMIENSAKTAPEWYGQALALFQRGKYLDARGILLPLEDSARAVDIQERVKLLIADTYFQQGGALNLAEALARYKTFLTFFPGSEHAGYAQYQLGRSYFKQLGHPDRDQSFTDQAIFEYQKLIDNYPDSPYVERAKADVLEAKARRAQHEYEVAKFYWDWNDKTASARRLQQVLKERPELPQREAALWMCAQSLYDTGKRDEGDAYAARLAADYPGSPYLSKLNANSRGALEKQMARDRKMEKQAARTARAQARADRRRTRIIRKDSGLPADVPQTWDVAGSTSAAAASPAASGAPGVDAAPGAAEDARAARKAEAASAAAAKAEADEQAQRAKEAEREAARASKGEKAAEKRAAEAAKKAEKRANETPEQAAKREKAEAKARQEAERLEAEEQRKAEREAARKKAKGGG